MAFVDKFCYNMTSRQFRNVGWDWERPDIIRGLNIHCPPLEMSSSEELLKCPVCKRIYNDPICLPCGHSLCAVCLQALFTDQNAAGPAPGETISCLTCGLSVSNSALEISQYPRNIALQKLCEYLTNSATDSIHSESMEDATFEVIFCDEHDDQAIERFCLICRKLICATCAESRSTTHAGHAIVSLSEGDNLADVCRRVVQCCEEDIAATRERLEVNQAHLKSVRSCNDSTEKAFRLLENNVASVLQGVFRRRIKQFQDAYKDAEIGCTEEGRILETRLTSTEVFRTKLTSLSANSRVPRLSEMHRTLSHLGTTTPDGVGTTVSDHGPDSFSSKLTEDLNGVLDLCVELLLRMKCPGAEVVSKVELLEASAQKRSIFEKGAEVKLNFETSIGRVDTSSPISHDHTSFSEFLDHEFPRKEDEVDERNGEDFEYKNSPGEKVNLLTDEKTGEEYYVELDEALDVKSLSENSQSTNSVNNSTSRETSDDSLPEVNFL